MAFVDAFRILNRLRRRGVVRDYVVIGAVAATAYMEPVFTEDPYIIILVDSDEEYMKAFQRVAELAEGMEGMHTILGGIPVQMFPSTTSPLFRDTLEGARPAKLGNLRLNMASPEHLILLYLTAFRERDRFRVRRLVDVADGLNIAPSWRGSMTKQVRLPADSKAYAEQVFLAKETLRRRRARMSFKRKLEALDRMREMARSLPKLVAR